MSENQSGPNPIHPTPGSPASSPDEDGATQTRIAATPFQISQEPITVETAAEALASVIAPVHAPAYEHLGELPASYGTQSVYLVAYDPRQLFAYWDLAPTDTADKKYSLHVCYADGGVETHLDIRSAEAGRYITTSRPGASYYVELGTYSRSGLWQVAATSGRVTLPPEGLAHETEPRFATLPFHLSFQRLMEIIEGTMGTREDLTLALSRLQQGERPASPHFLGALSHLSSGQLRTLELLLGDKFATDSQAAGVSAGVRSSENFAPTMGGGSEALSSAAGAFGSETLSSQALGSETVSSFSSGGMGGESVSSFTAASASSSEGLPVFMRALGGSESVAAMVGHLNSEVLSSLMGGPGGSETLSSGGFGSESLYSLLAGMGSESLSSFFALLAAGGSGGSEGLSSGLLARGPSSEAWRMAGSGGPSGSDTLSSEQTAILLRAMENNLDVLGSLFSHGFGNSEALSSPGGYAGTAGGLASSEGVARRKSLW